MKNNKRFSYFFLFLFFYSQFFLPIQAFALTISTSQPEYSGFMSANQTEMVDPFTGDFNYNIPLMDVEGYPINLFYNAGIHTEQEASWVGLGWNINPGAISRTMRGLPDDFSGELVKREFSLAPNITSGTRHSFGGSVSIGPYSGSIDYSSGQFNSSNFGPGYESFISTSHGATLSLSTDLIFMAFGAPPPPASAFVGASVGGSIGIGFNTHEGALLNFSLTRTFFYGAAGGYGNEKASAGAKVQMNHTKSAGLSLSSSSGLKNLSLTYSNGISIGLTGGSEKHDVSASGNFGFSNTKSGSIPVGTFSYTPAPTVGFFNRATSNTDQDPSMTPIIEFYSSLTDYEASSKVLSTVKESPAFGYYYDYFGLLNKEALLDYNVERAGPPVETNPYLSPSNQTYDFYSISAQGYSSVFRPNKNYVGISGATPTMSKTTSNSQYKEKALGMTGYRDISSSGMSVGINISERWLEPYTTYMPSSLQLQGHLTNNFFGAFNNNLHSFKKVDFHNNGSKVPVDQAFHDYLEDQELIAFNILPEVFTKKSILANNYSVYSGSSSQASFVSSIPTSIPGNGRQVEAENFSPLTISEAQSYGFQKQIQVFGINDFTVSGQTNSMNYQSLLSRDYMVSSGNVNTSQFSEITCNSSDGSRYIYGIPNYVKEQVELNFSTSIEGNSVPNIDDLNGLIDYTDNEVEINNSNHRGTMKLVDKKTLPPYASSYQITAILSADYVDITGNGPTPDDIGDYTKFNYSKLPDYNFRSPVGNGKQARYSKGYNLDKEDDMGSIFYGTRERWYLHSIESKNYVACFVLNDINIHPRVDALGVNNGVDGNVVQNDVRSLRQIDLYSKKELSSSNNPIPIKTAHFYYAPLLCQKAPNNMGYSLKGKSTLMALAFTGGGSERGKKYHYSFEYNNNPDYGGKNFERWGNYDANGPGLNDNEDFPYTSQNVSTTNANASAWNLTDIYLPGGGKIEINYESDDYAYVQDQNAAMMFPVLGLLPPFFAFGNSPGTPQLDLYNNTGASPVSYSHQYLAIDITKRPIPNSYPSGMSFSSSDPLEMKREYFKKKYLESCRVTNTNNTEYRLYFRFSIILDPSKPDHDFVPGYASFSPEGTLFDSNGNTAYLRINNVNIYDDENGITEIQNSSNFNLLNSLLNIVPVNNSVEYVSPFAKAAWQMVKKDLRHKVFNYNDPIPGNTANSPSIFAIKTLFEKTIEYLNGEFIVFKKNSIAKTMVAGESLVRLNDPKGKKMGGGYRVKSIVTSDNWNYGSEGIYEQTYSYQTINEFNEVISSGVATYEPFSGGDENVLHKPLNFYTDKVIFAPNNEYYFEGPIGESMYPNPSVGYSKITVTQKVPINSRSKTGKVIYEYYTAKDFPIYAKASTKKKNLRTPTEVEIKSEGLTSSGLYESQGFVLFMNDMHGKPKAILTCEEGKSEAEAVSGVRYTYLTTGQGKILGEDALCTNDGLNVNYAKLATELDISINANHRIDYSTNINFTSTTQIEAPMSFGMTSDVSTTTVDNSYGAVTCTKVISKFGILNKTETWNNYENSKTIAENIVWDAKTGEVVLQRVTNPYGNHNQLLNIPAHWIYKGMGVAKQNLGILLPVNFASGVPVEINSSNSYLTPGDEVAIVEEPFPGICIPSPAFTNTLWVAKSDDGNYNGNYVLIDNQGNLFTPNSNSGSNTKLKVIRSGYRNNLENKAGNIVSHTNQNGLFPDNSNTSKGFLLKQNGSSFFIDLSEKDRILEASATEYSDWRLILAQPETGSNLCIQNELGKDLTDLFKLIILNNQSNTTACVELTAAPYAKYFINPYNHIRTIKSVVEESTSSLHNQLYGKLSWIYVPGGFGMICKGVKIDLYSDCQDASIGNISLSLNQLNNTGFHEFPEAGTFSQLYFDNSNCRWTAIATIGNNNYTHPDLGFSFSPSVADVNFRQMGCFSETFTTCNGEATINPYTSGIAGNWYASKNYSIVSSRIGTSTLPVKEKGYLSDYESFWMNNSGWKNILTNDEVLKRWVLKSEISQINIDGNILEAKSKSANFNATKYGYNNELPIANIINGRNEQVLNFNFECDPSTENLCFPLNYTMNRTDFGIAHTGKYAMRVNENGESEIPGYFDITQKFPLWKDYLTNSERSTIINIPYAVKQKDIVTTFTPASNFAKGTKYVISAWFYQSKTPLKPFIPQNTSGQIPIEYIIKVDGNIVNPSSITTSKIIDGWQKVDAIYEFDGWEQNCNMQIGIQITNTQNVANIFMDDLRIFPYNANVTTKVYHPVDRKLMAELDANNFATFYVYGDNGELIGTKKETKDGILSISEKRTGIAK